MVGLIVRRKSAAGLTFSHGFGPPILSAGSAHGEPGDVGARCLSWPAFSPWVPCAAAVVDLFASEPSDSTAAVGIPVGLMVLAVGAGAR